MSKANLGILAILALATPGCWHSPPSRVYPDKPDPRAGAIAIELFDANKDGFLDGKELDQVPGLKAAMKQVDSNHDGKISAEEITARIQQSANSKVGRISIVCVVTHNGQPLAGATVRFVPEKFLRGDIKTAEGITGRSGVCRMTIPGKSGPPGVCPGFYRIEITKSGEKIPAKYNTETQLGQEVASDGEGLGSGPLRLDLKY